MLGQAAYVFYVRVMQKGFDLIQAHEIPVDIVHDLEVFTFC